MNVSTASRRVRRSFARVETRWSASSARVRITSTSCARVSRRARVSAATGSGAAVAAPVWVSCCVRATLSFWSFQTCCCRASRSAWSCDPPPALAQLAEASASTDATRAAPHAPLTFRLKRAPRPFPRAVSLGQEDELVAPVLGPGRLIVDRVERTLLAEGHDAQAARGRPQGHEIVARRPGPLFAQGQIVFHRAALVAVALDAQFELGVLLDRRGVVAQRPDGVRAEIVLVEIELDPLQHTLGVQFFGERGGGLLDRF